MGGTPGPRSQPAGGDPETGAGPRDPAGESGSRVSRWPIRSAGSGLSRARARGTCRREGARPSMGPYPGWGEPPGPRSQPAGGDPETGAGPRDPAVEGSSVTWWPIRPAARSERVGLSRAGARGILWADGLATNLATKSGSGGGSGASPQLGVRATVAPSLWRRACYVGAATAPIGC
jgi:hypothetical protein